MKFNKKGQATIGVGLIVIAIVVALVASQRQQPMTTQPGTGGPTYIQFPGGWQFPDLSGLFPTTTIPTDQTTTTSFTTVKTTIPVTGLYKCCQSKMSYYCAIKCNRGDFTIRSYSTLKTCQLYCKKGLPTTTTKTTTPTTSLTTTVSGIVTCRASWPIPRGEKDCNYRSGCQKYEVCKYYYDIKLGGHCECTSKWTTTPTTSPTTIPTTTPTTIIDPSAECSNKRDFFGYEYYVISGVSGGWNMATCDAECDYYCDVWVSGNYVCTDSMYLTAVTTNDCCILKCGAGITTTTTTVNCESTCHSAGYARYGSGQWYTDECYNFANLVCEGHGGFMDSQVVENCCCYECYY